MFSIWSHLKDEVFNYLQFLIYFEFSHRAKRQFLGELPTLPGNAVAKNNNNNYNPLSKVGVLPPFKNSIMCKKGGYTEY